MKPLKLLASGLVTLILSAGAAVSAPLPAPMTSSDLPTIVETVRGHDCYWRRGAWVRIDHHGHLRACRPHSPGHGWIWHHDGHRHGWYHPHRRSWHHHHRHHRHHRHW